MKRWAGTAAAALVVLTAGACGSSSSSSAPTPTLAAKLEPAGVNPSKSARMVCASEANGEITQALEVKASTTTTTTSADHVYTCKYEYPQGSVTRAVKELSRAAGTKAYFSGLEAQMGKRDQELALGQGAFIASNGPVVVRKDWKVLTVDVTGLPATFGKQQLNAAQAGEAIAARVMGCWSGA